MFLKKNLYLFSHAFYDMHEFQQAQTLMNNNAFSQAHDLFLRLIQILKPHGRLPNDLLSISYQNSVKVGPKQQNDILQYKLDTLGNVLQYMQNNLYYNTNNNMDLLVQHEPQFIGNVLHYEFKRVEAYNYALLSSPETEEKLISLIEYSEARFQKEQSLLDYAILKWLASGHGYNPVSFNANFGIQQGQVLLDHFLNAEAKVDKMTSIDFSLKLYKALSDFIISANVQTYNKTIVGQVLNRYLKFTEKKAKNQVHKSLMGLGWLNTVEQRYMSAEGLFRTIDDQLKTHNLTPEIQVLTAQFWYLNIQLLQKLTKRQTEVQNYQQQLKQFKMSPVQQKAVLYCHLPNHQVQFLS
ncbi:unnamed protein product [Paramecium primaurelia]|uniref:Uncharacterized protein n=1 Tax=Paramecium primaurelia TaxID=5886 RepID=A0A8S1LU14_PARPR|nr:unnamed protein product [Paramecium primaurelia]